MERYPKSVHFLQAEIGRLQLLQQASEQQPQEFPERDTFPTLEEHAHQAIRILTSDNPLIYNALGWYARGIIFYAVKRHAREFSRSNGQDREREKEIVREGIEVVRLEHPTLVRRTVRNVVSLGQA